MRAAKCAAKPEENCAERLVEAQRVEEDLPPVDAFRMEFELRDFVPDRGMNELEVTFSDSTGASRQVSEWSSTTALGSFMLAYQTDNTWYRSAADMSGDRPSSPLM